MNMLTLEEGRKRFGPLGTSLVFGRRPIRLSDPIYGHDAPPPTPEELERDRKLSAEMDPQMPDEVDLMEQEYLARRMDEMFEKLHRERMGEKK